MNTGSKKALWSIVLVPLVLLSAWLLFLYHGSRGRVRIVRHPAKPVRMVVMDPLCGALACDCVAGYAQRDYAVLGAFLERKLGRPVEVSYGPNLSEILELNPGNVDLIVGKASTVRFDAGRVNEAVRPIARLTDRQGRTDTVGLYVVRKNDAAQTITDLANHRILFGPRYAEEKYPVALATLAEHGVAAVPPVRTAPSCSAAALTVVEGGADAAVISSYNLPFLEGCGTIDEGALRVVGQTAPVPFVTVFATAAVPRAAEQEIVDVLLSVGTDRVLLEALESQSGFVPAETDPAAQEHPSAPTTIGWTDWRGPGRTAVSADVPTSLPETANFLWKHGLTGIGLSGLAATATHLIVADKSEEKDRDIWRCLDADTGEELWTIAYATPKEMEFTNAPRATPVIHGDFAYLLGAFGDLHCVSLRSSRILWRRNIVKDFGATLPTWGMSSTPLIVAGKLIVNPGAPDASLVALGLYAGEVIWQTPGEPAAYASFILGSFGGVTQIVGYDAVSLGGWDPNNGKRLWTLLPDQEGDFNVPTPIHVNGRLLVSTENNGTRLYDFDGNGQIRPIPVAENLDLAPDTSTPVATDGLVFGCYAGLFCLDLDDDLKTLYSIENDKVFDDYAALIAGNGHLLVVTVEGELILLKVTRNSFTPVSRLRLFRDTEVWSHPALVGDRLYIRSMNEVCCLLLTGPHQPAPRAENAARINHRDG